MFTRMHDSIRKTAVIVLGKLDHVVTNSQDCLGIVGEGRITRVQVIKPQEQPDLLVEYRVAETVVQGIEIAAEELGKIDGLDDSPKHRGTTACSIAIHHEGTQAQSLGPLDGVLFGCGRGIDLAALFEVSFATPALGS